MMSERAFRRFEAEARCIRGRYAEALAAAEAYLQSELNEYERAMGEQLAGYILVALDRLEEAVPRFERAIELDALPNSRALRDDAVAGPALRGAASSGSGPST
jgi:tetratricopeptide (TPR) repeat protein